MTADLRFWFDPVCPFAWMTSRWVRMVAEQRAYEVDWSLVSLRLVNSHVDYDSHFPSEYEAGHTAGLRLLRVVHRAREEHGAEVVGPLYLALGTRIWDSGPLTGLPSDAAVLGPALEQTGLPAALMGALDDADRDEAIRAEGEEAFALTGKDVGTPVLHFQPPTGVAFFGPVISRLPEPAQAVELWDHVIGLASFGGFAELKRSLRELPQLSALGVSTDEVGATEDWHGGSRRQKR